MKIVCAWCKIVISDDGEEGVSHGMCDDCLEEQMEKIIKEQEEKKKK